MIKNDQFNGHQMNSKKISVLFDEKSAKK